VTPVLLSVNVGLPRNVSWQGRTVYTGVWKHPVDGPVMVRRLNIDGDGQGDLAGHGGEQRAVLVYQAESYRHWARHFGRDDLSHGSFGENFTVTGLADDEVCIRDRYRIGEAEFEVTQPRVTCYRVGLRLGEPQLPALLVSHHRPGFYLRVHGARGPREAPLAAEAHTLLAGLPHAHEHVCYSQEQGRLSKDKLAALGVPADATAYLCGPDAFMAEMRQALTAIGIAAERIHIELFGALASINPGITDPSRRPLGGPPGPGPLVTFARSGISAAFGTGRRSVLELAERAGVPSRWSCRTGVCHTCVTPLLSGQVRYAPDPLEPPDDGQVLICCAQPDTDIVLDM
jgi:ferredoxin